MASEAHNAKKQKVLHIEGRPVDLPRKRISSSTKKIMKEVRYSCLPMKLNGGYQFGSVPLLSCNLIRKS
uniref:Uncharacterized protein n=1 Tax=Pavo cristatus TaxID=9049 RepID=A0A8C9FVE7_PAVCR